MRTQVEYRKLTGMPPICLRCDSLMTIETITPTLFAHPVDDICYVCPSCNFATKQTVRGVG